MANFEGQNQQKIEVADQQAGRDSTITQLAQRLFDEADNLARGVKDDAKREAEAETARILSEAQRRAEQIVEAASDRARRLEFDAHEAVKKITDNLKGELEAAVDTLAKLPHGPGRTEETPRAVMPAGPQGYDVQSQTVSPGPH